MFLLIDFSNYLKKYISINEEETTAVINLSNVTKINKEIKERLHRVPDNDSWL